MKIRIAFTITVDEDALEAFWRARTGRKKAWLGNKDRSEARKAIAQYVEQHGCADLNDALEEARRDSNECRTCGYSPCMCDQQ